MPRSSLSRPGRLVAAPLLRAQSDDRLVDLVRDGHEAAFAVVVARYRAPLERYAAGIVGAGRAEDVVQQAFVNAHRALMSDGRSIELKPWLYRITHNAALNLLRSAPAETSDGADLAGALGPSSAGAADVAALRARLRETLDAVAALPPPQRDALLLRELEGRSHEEIALALGVTAGAARQHLARARTSLRAAVSALTPYPLLAKLAVLGAGSSTTGAVAEVVAGAGVGATVIKLGAGVAAGGALLGSVVLPSPPTDRVRGDDRGAATAVVSRQPSRRAVVPGPSPAPAEDAGAGAPELPAVRRASAGASAPSRRTTARPTDDDDDRDEAAESRPAGSRDDDDTVQGDGPRPAPAGSGVPGSGSESSGPRPSSGSAPERPDDDDDPVPSSGTPGSSSSGSGSGASGGDDDTDPPESGSHETGTSGSGSSGSSGTSSSGHGSGSDADDRPDDEREDDERPDVDDVDDD